jgi:hypothetical protein
MFLHALTIFLSAFLLFQVQPLIGKYLLPWFGGGPGVWTTCLLFFQALLLGGYAYAHLITSRLQPRAQAHLHLGLLAVALCTLPIIPDAGWKPAAGTEPVTHILLLLTVCLGLPYVVLSATGPLLQRWFSLTHPGVPPWRLYALSNAGSLLALLSYPFVFEPLLSRPAQGWAWSAGFGLFALLCGACAWRMRRLAAPAPTAEADPLAPAPTLLDRLMWLALPAVASLLLVATTNRLCLDIAAVPFLWIVPLAIYLLSFILCFDHPRWYDRRLFAALLAVGCGAVVHLLGLRAAPLPLQVAVYSLVLLAACMVCHGELHRLRPAPRHLTAFYLTIAAGGALGSVLVGVVAPLALSDYRELQIGLVLLVYLAGVLSLLYRHRGLVHGLAAGTLAILLVVPALRAEAGLGFPVWVASLGRQIRFFAEDYWKESLAGFVVLVFCLRDGWRIGTGPWSRRLSAFPLMLSVLLGLLFIVQAVDDRRTVLVAVRNFYGTLKLRQYNETDPATHYHLLAHGETTHGLQLRQESFRGLAASYYGSTSGVGRVLDLLPGTRRLGLVGLGVGTLAVYGRPGDTLRFYEINPAVEPIAREGFTYLRDAVADIEIVPGDARLVLEDELARGRPQAFDALVLDAFSSDAIPVHLLTREAMTLYLAHLRPGGVIAVHISNRFLDLQPVVEGLARHHGLHAVTISDDPPDEEWWVHPTTWVLLSRDEALLTTPDLAVATEAREENPRTVDWTDDHASLFGILK